MRPCVLRLEAEMPTIRPCRTVTRRTPHLHFCPRAGTRLVNGSPPGAQHELRAEGSNEQQDAALSRGFPCGVRSTGRVVLFPCSRRPRAVARPWSQVEAPACAGEAG